MTRSAVHAPLSHLLGANKQNHKNPPRAELRGAGVSFQVPSLICKPSSVVYGHLSRRVVADALQRYSRHMPNEQPMRHMPNLAPDGVCTARPVTEASVSSYLPFPSLQDKPAVCFCCTFLGVASTGRYPASCSAVLGLSSRRKAARPYDQLGLLLYPKIRRKVNPFGAAATNYFFLQTLVICTKIL